MDSFFDKLKGAIFEEEPQTEPAESTAPASVTVSTSTTAPVQNSVLLAPTSDLNNPLLPKLKLAVMARQTNLKALLDNMEAMKSAVPDDMARLKAAYAIISKNGVKAAQLAQELNLHLTDLENHAAQFESESAAQKEQRVGAKTAQKQQLIEQTAQTRQAMDALRKQTELRIIEMQKQIDANQSKVLEVDRLIQTESAELDKTAQLFAGAKGNVLTWLKGMSSLINTLE